VTLDEITAHAGLQSFDSYRTMKLYHNRVAIERGDIHPKRLYRGMGYTTEMVLKALAACSDGGPVYLIDEVYDPCHRLLNEARKMARGCGFNQDLIQYGPNTIEFVKGLPADRVFFDHTVDRPVTP